MISGLLVLVLGDILAQPGKFSDLALVIVLSFELVFLVVLPRREQGFAFDGLIVRQHVFTFLQIKWPFWISVEVWVCLRCCHAFVVFGGVRATWQFY